MLQSHPRSTSLVLYLLSLLLLGPIASSAADVACSETATVLCLNNSRFEVKVTDKTGSGDMPDGQAVPLTLEAGAFWFFSPENLDVAVKVLSPTPDNNYFQVFLGSLTSQEYQVEIRDTATGMVKTYRKDGLTSSVDTMAFPADKMAFTNSLVEPLVPRCHLDPSNPTVEKPVTFIDDSLGNPTDWAWSFGDEHPAGFSSTERQPTHVYHEATSFEVRLRVSRLSGAATETVEATCAEVLVRPACELQFFPNKFTTPFSPDGGVESGSAITVTSSDKNCEWTVTSNQPYLRINSPEGGAGKGSTPIQFRFLANNSLQSRDAKLTIRLGDVTVKEYSLSQRGDSCSYSLEPSQASFTAEEHSNPQPQVSVRPNFQSCTWEVSTDSDFVKLSGKTSGTGDGEVPYIVLENTKASPRQAILTVQGNPFVISQAGCVVTSDLAFLHEIGPGGISPVLQVTTDSPKCTWDASSTGSFLTLSPDSYTGNQNLSLQVSPNTSSLARTGSLTIAGQTIKVTQRGCATTTPSFVELDSGSLNGEVQVTEEIDKCQWVAESNASFIHVQERTQTGFREYNVPFSVDDSEGVERLGTLSVAGEMVIVKQKGDAPLIACAQLMPPGAGFFDSLGGVGRLDVRTTSTENCDWQAEPPTATFLKIQKDSADKASFCVAANRGGQRGGRLTLSQLPLPQTPPPITSFFNVFQDPLDGGDPAQECTGDDKALCLLGGRFEVRATFGDAPSNRQGGHAVAVTQGSGYFWLFNSSNPELVVKVIDGTGFTESFWAFSGALTNLPYTLTVTDTKTRKQVFFCNLDNSFQSFADIDNLKDQP